MILEVTLPEGIVTPLNGLNDSETDEKFFVRSKSFFTNITEGFRKTLFFDKVDNSTELFTVWADPVQ